MIKLEVFLCAGFILVRNAELYTDNFGSFWGSCPEQPFDSFSITDIWQIQGKWYTHFVLGQYSPLKHTECRINEIHVIELQNITIITKFSAPLTKILTEWNGEVEVLNMNAGQFVFHYNIDDGVLLQNTAILQNFHSGAALVWTCMEFYTFHFESIAVVTKYQDPQDSRIDPIVYESMNETLLNHGILPSWFEQIDQYNCK